MSGVPAPLRNSVVGRNTNDVQIRIPCGAGRRRYERNHAVGGHYLIIKLGIDFLSGGFVSELLALRKQVFNVLVVKLVSDKAHIVDTDRAAMSLLAEVVGFFT